MELNDGIVGVGVLTGGGIVWRMLYSWWKRQNSTDHLLDERDKHMDQVRNDLKQCRDNTAAILAEVERLKEQNTELRIQNAMLRQLLLAQGMTVEALEKLERDIEARG